MKPIKTALLAAALVVVASGQAQAAAPALCVEKACLGMTLAEAESLDFIAPEMFAFKFSPKGEMYGLDGNGQRIHYAEGGDVDAELIRKFNRSVNTICSLGSISARTRDSQGQRVNLMFSAVLRDGKPVVVLSEIARLLPRKMSDAELQRAAEQAQAQYGAAYAPEWSLKISRPTASLYADSFIGHALMLRLPQQEVSAQLLKQPGCNAK